ncbi:MAG: hypothetical protein LBF59_10440 [Prevotellaceae bacterium]|jgi:hypothetical protein|nr:hypothetical protein [Prevotellaceae bacterium]
MKSIALKFGLSETATEAEILTEIGALQATASTADNLQRQIDRQLTKAIEGVEETDVKTKEIFDRYDKNELYFTSDGLAFFEKSDAVNRMWIA